jgi:5-(aminomethyl)-3-furanmethanol phosphate kinase
MIVVKLGGSYAYSPLLRPWLNAIEAARGEAVIVPGGGPFADSVRAAQPRMGFGDHAAHEMALLAITQYAVALVSLSKALVLASSLGSIQAALIAGRVPVWSPWPMLRDSEDVPASWDITSDALSIWLAGRLEPPLVMAGEGRPSTTCGEHEEVVDARSSPSMTTRAHSQPSGPPPILLVKHRSARGGAGPRELSTNGLLDPASPRLIEHYGGAVYIAGPDDVPEALDPRAPPGRRIPARKAA